MEKDKDEVRQRILAAAKELFVQQGYKKTTIRQIVEKSGRPHEEHLLFLQE